MEITFTDNIRMHLKETLDKFVNSFEAKSFYDNFGYDNSCIDSIKNLSIKDIKNNIEHIEKLIKATLIHYEFNNIDLEKIIILKKIKAQIKFFKFSCLIFNRTTAKKSKDFKNVISQTITKLNTYIKQSFDYILKNTLQQSTYYKINTTRP